MSPNRTTQSYGARVEETALGNYVADAFRQAAGTDIAIECGGHLVKSLPGGDLTAADAAAVFDRDRMVVAVELTAGQLFALLEHGVGTLDIDEAEQLEPGVGLLTAFHRFPASPLCTKRLPKSPAGGCARSPWTAGAALSAGETRTLTAARRRICWTAPWGSPCWRACPPAVGLQSELLSSLMLAQPEVSIPGDLACRGAGDCRAHPL